MWQEFKAFIAQGNVLDLAVAVIIGAAFGKIVTSLTEDLIMPLIAGIFGNVDFSSKFMILGSVPDSYTGSLTDSIS
jgi:large conductance mechanosensitive channel